MPTSPILLSPAEKKSLKALAHGLSPVVMIGDKGLAASVIKEIDISLSAHQLIKIRVLGDDREHRLGLIEQISEITNAALVQHIGKLLVFYRPSDKGGLLQAPVEKKKPGIGRGTDKPKPRTPSLKSAYSPTIGRATSARKTLRSTNRGDDQTFSSERPIRRPKRPA